MYDVMFRNAISTAQISYELAFCVTAVGVSVSQMSLTSVLMPPAALHLRQFAVHPVTSLKLTRKLALLTQSQKELLPEHAYRRPANKRGFARRTSRN